MTHWQVLAYRWFFLLHSYFVGCPVVILTLWLALKAGSDSHQIAGKETKTFTCWLASEVVKILMQVLPHRSVSLIDTHLCQEGSSRVGLPTFQPVTDDNGQKHNNQKWRQHTPSRYLPALPPNVDNWCLSVTQHAITFQSWALLCENTPLPQARLCHLGENGPTSGSQMSMGPRLVPLTPVVGSRMAHDLHQATVCPAQDLGGRVERELLLSQACWLGCRASYWRTWVLQFGLELESYLHYWPRDLSETSQYL